MCCPQGPQPFPPPQGINPTHCRKNPPERNGLVFPYFHGAPFPQKRAQCWPRAGSRRCVSRPRAVPAPRARGRDLAPRTALPEPAAPRGKRLLPGLAPASPKIQLNGTGFSTNLSGRIQPRGAGARPCAAFGACWKLGARDIPCEPQILAQPWHRGPQHVPWGWGGVPAYHLPVGNAQVGLPCLFDPKPVFFLEEFSQIRAIKTMGKWKVFCQRAAVAEGEGAVVSQPSKKKPQRQVNNQEVLVTGSGCACPSRGGGTGKTLQLRGRVRQHQTPPGRGEQHLLLPWCGDPASTIHRLCFARVSPLWGHGPCGCAVFCRLWCGTFFCRAGQEQDSRVLLPGGHRSPRDLGQVI